MLPNLQALLVKLDQWAPLGKREPKGKPALQANLDQLDKLDSLVLPDQLETRDLKAAVVLQVRLDQRDLKEAKV
jgi:hypothetical protein